MAGRVANRFFQRVWGASAIQGVSWCYPALDRPRNALRKVCGRVQYLNTPTLPLPALWMHSSDSALHNVPPRLYCMLERMYGTILWQAWETSGAPPYAPQA